MYLIRAYSNFLIASRALDFPLVLQLQTQSFCNGRCSICPYRIVKKKLDQGTMEWNLFEKIASESASRHRLSTVIFHLQNEPLLDKRIFDWVRYFKTIRPGTFCTMNTNGELLDRFSTADIIQSNLDRLIISINAYSKEVYESINNGLNYDNVMKNIASLISNPSLRHKVMLDYVLTKQNLLEVHQAMQHWKKQGLQTRVVELTNRAGSLEGYENIRPTSHYYNNPVLSRAWRRWAPSIKSVLGCHIPFYHMSILFNGDVICCQDWNRAIIVGNIRTNSLREVWNSEKMNEIRRLILRKRYNQINMCQECSFVK